MHDELTVTGVTRTFDGRTALDDVSFTVRPGRMTGFVGANGAGKTTTMRIILGVLAPDAGRVTLGGVPLTLPVRRRFGYMPEERGLYPKMKVAEQLVYLARVHGVRPADARRRVADLLDRLGLTERSDDLLQTLSLGNQQRVQVAAALVHDPILLVLDEPFSGLDPLAVDTMAEQLRSRVDAGLPVLFSSHQLELVERLCDDVVIIDRGRVLAAGPAEQVRGAHTVRRYRLRVEAPPGAADDATPAGAPRAGDRPGNGGPDVVVPAFLAQVPGASVHRCDGALIEVDLADGTDGAPAGDDQTLLAAAQRYGTVREFTPVTPTLAEIFREVVR